MTEKIENKELINVTGGAIINASLLNSFARAGEFMYNLGRSCGTAVRMIFSKKRC